MQIETRKTESEESQPLTELIGRLSSDLRLLAKEETELAKRELSEKLEQAKLQAATLALGASAAAGGALLLLAAAVLGLALLVPAWLAALVVGLIVLGVGGLLVATGKAKLARIQVRPDRALAGIRRDVDAIKGAMS
ncbi:MAG TPA: phage holin family protein [Polyangiaceae bacterium]